VIEVPGKGFRRVVPSPWPKEICEMELIDQLFADDRVVVCCGGGGIPIVDRPDWGEEGVEAVIDKDLTAALLATGTRADTLAILTGVEKVYLNYGKPDQKPLDQLSIQEAKKMLAEGQFPPGSMGPKIQACINFLEMTPEPHAVALITSIEGCLPALDGKTGTRIVR
jgi:carbamate kinase